MQLIKSINYKYNIILNAKSLTTAGVERIRNQKRILVPVYNPIFGILSNIPEVTLLKIKNKKFVFLDVMFPLEDGNLKEQISVF